MGGWRQEDAASWRVDGVGAALHTLLAPGGLIFADKVNVASLLAKWDSKQKGKQVWGTEKGMNFDVNMLRDGLTVVAEEDFGMSPFKAWLGHSQAVTLHKMFCL